MNKTSLLKSNKGITMIALVLTIAIMIILTVTVTINIDGYAQRKKKGDLETDIIKLKEEVDLYYSKYKELPIANKYINTEALNKIELWEQKSVNDNENYYVIDLDLLDVEDLAYGKDFGKLEDKTSDVTEFTDIYIVNEQSHMIYYPQGVFFKDKTLYTTLGNDNAEIELVATQAIITFDSNGGSGTMEDQTVITGRSQALNENQFTPPEGYSSFNSWNTRADGTGDTYTTAITTNDSITLYAQWTPITYTITYNLDGGTMTNQKTTYTVADDDYTLPKPNKMAYVFRGWTGSNGSTIQNTVTLNKGSTGDKTYDANWTMFSSYSTLSDDGLMATRDNSTTTENYITTAANMTLVPSKTYTISFEYKTTSNCKGGQCYLLNVYNTNDERSLRISYSANTSWQTKSTTYTTPSSLPYNGTIYLRFDNDGSNGGVATLYLRNVSIR